MKANYNIVDLVERAKKKDALAINVLYNKSVNNMLSLSYKITQNYNDTEDILQEAYLQSFQLISQLNKPENYFGWLKTIVVNLSLKHVKRKRHFTNLKIVEIEEEKEDDTTWYTNIPFEVINKAINNLPNGSREIFTLFLLEDYKHKEIAELLNISISTSKSQYRYALKLLKQNLTCLNNS